LLVVVRVKLVSNPLAEIDDIEIILLAVRQKNLPGYIRSGKKGVTSLSFKKLRVAS
jgi:hypothetical protein